MYPLSYCGVVSFPSFLDFQSHKYPLPPYGGLASALRSIFSILLHFKAMFHPLIHHS